MVKPDNPEAVASTPHREHYQWGEIGYNFYEGWIEDVRSCGNGLRERLAKEARLCAAADRLLGGICSIHYEDGLAPRPEPPEAIPHGSELLNYTWRNRRRMVREYKKSIQPERH